MPARRGKPAGHWEMSASSRSAGAVGPVDIPCLPEFRVNGTEASLAAAGRYCPPGLIFLGSKGFSARRS